MPAGGKPYPPKKPFIKSPIVKEDKKQKPQPKRGPQRRGVPNR